MLEISNVTHSYSAGGASLSNLSMVIDSKKIVAILGQSGSGKSTLLRLVNGLLLADQGEVVCLGANPKLLSRSKLRKLRKRVGFIPQDLGLVERLSVLENVLIGGLSALRLPRLGVFSYPESFTARAKEILDDVGLSGMELRRADSLSGGERQRVAVARCLMQNPDLILADEPVSSLDPETSAQILELLTRISRERMTPMVMSLHQPKLAVQFADRILGLRDGELVLDLPAKEFTRNHEIKIYGSD